MCILQSHKMWTFEVLPLWVDIVNYLVPMWHVSSNKFHFSFWLSFGSCLCEFAWCGFLEYVFPYIIWGNHLFHIILTMALPVGSNSWNYQQTLLKYGVSILIFHHMIYLVSIILDFSTTKKIVPFTHCPWTIDIHICGRISLIILTFGSCYYLPHLLPSIYFDSRWLPCLLHESYISIGIV